MFFDLKTLFNTISQLICLEARRLFYSCTTLNYVKEKILTVKPIHLEPSNLIFLHQLLVMLMKNVLLWKIPSLKTYKVLKWNIINIFRNPCISWELLVRKKPLPILLIYLQSSFSYRVNRKRRHSHIHTFPHRYTHA